MLAYYAPLLAACFRSVHAAATTANTTSQFYGYGKGISGLPLFAAGTSNSTTQGAYIGNGIPPEAPVASSVTLTLESSNKTMLAHPIGSNTTAPTQNWSLFINNGSDSNTQAGFANAKSSNSSMTFTGMAIWGQYLVWIDSDGSYISKWSAVPTDTDGVYAVYWNSANTKSDTALSMVLKNVGPTTT